MSLGQTMLSIATLVALTVMVVTSQQYLIEGQKEEIKAEALDLAAMQCESLLAEISGKKFDAIVTDYRWRDEWEFTDYYSLGPNSTERSKVVPWPDLKPYKSNTSFDDVDDYHTYLRTVNTDLITGIQLDVQVYYVEEWNPTVKVYYETYYKRVVVKANFPSYLDMSSITFSTVLTY